MPVRKFWAQLSPVWKKELSESWARERGLALPDALPWLRYGHQRFSGPDGERELLTFEEIAGEPPDTFFGELEALRALRFDHAGEIGPLDALEHLPALSELSLVSCQFPSIRPLRERALERLNLSSTRGWPTSELRLLSAIRELILFDLPLPDLGFVARQRELRSLSLRSQQLRSLGGLDGAHLEHLGASHCNKLSDLNALWGMNSLRSLMLLGTAVDDLGLAVIGSLSNLRELALRSPHPTDLSALRGLPLRRLELAAVGVDDSQLDILVAFDDLERVDVTGCSLSEDAITVLRERFGEDAVLPHAQ